MSPINKACIGTPWRVSRTSVDNLKVVDRDGLGICHFTYAPSWSEERACLIAAAPELLEALSDLLYYSDDVSSPLLYSNAVDAAKAAIAKATGAV